MAHVSSSEAPREEHVETEVRAPVAATRPAATPIARASRLPAESPATVAPSTHTIERTQETTTRERTHERSAIEHRTVVEVPPPAVMQPVTMPIATREVLEIERLVTSPQWLTEDPRTPDPLVASADSDTLRELLRSVRQWTSSAPTVIESEPKPEPVHATPVVPAPAPTQVSIGNVVITVEDAPAPARGGRPPSPARSSTDRMARNYIRGG
jgi:hypothetical protein